MHVDHNMLVIGCNMHVTCTLFRIGKFTNNLPVLSFCKLPKGLLVYSTEPRLKIIPRSNAILFQQGLHTLRSTLLKFLELDMEIVSPSISIFMTFVIYAVGKSVL